MERGLCRLGGLSRLGTSLRWCGGWKGSFGSFLAPQGAADHGQLPGEATLRSKELAERCLVSHLHLGDQVEEGWAGGDGDTPGQGGNDK